MDEEALLKILKAKSKEIMEKDKNFHDFAHVIGVYRNVEKILKYEAGNRLVLLSAALFHDVKRDVENHGTEGAVYVRKILYDIRQFPEEFIEPVAGIIETHDKTPLTLEQKILYDADKMDFFNNLSIARSFMMMAKEGISLKDACFKQLNLMDYYYGKLNTTAAKTLSQKNYQETKKVLAELIERYNIND